MAESSDSAAGGGTEIERADLKRTFFLLLGIGLFAVVYLSPTWPSAVDPEGSVFVLTHEGKAALGLFLLAATWWVTEVVPIGVTAIAIGVVQSLWLIRDSRTAFTDFMDPSVWFIFGSLSIGVAFTKTGLTKRMAYKMLAVVGERTSMIYLGCFGMTTVLTLFMAHTAVAATIFPLLITIHDLYTNETTPTRFGKGLFMGMAFVAGAGSIITLLGAARGAVAVSFFAKIEGGNISFFELTYYMAPVGILMTLLIWVFLLFWFRPEKKTIPGLKAESRRLYEKLGPWRRNEKLALGIVLATVLVLAFRSFVPALSQLDKSGIILVSTLLFFIFRILRLADLESTSWNIVLLFGGAMSIGFCLWQTGAADWLAIHWLSLFETAHWAVFVMALAFFVLVMTNLIMNVAAIAISMPVALVCSRYLGVSGELILFACLVTAGMPFLLLVGAAPNAIAYASKQFTSREFFLTGLPVSLILMVVLAVFVTVIWPMMGMPIHR